MYTVDYFIKKFEAIPDYQICVGFFWDDILGGCANGHCGIKSYSHSTNKTTEAIALDNVLKRLKLTRHDGRPVQAIVCKFYSICAMFINDKEVIEYQQETAKQRILAALKDVKKLQTQQQPVYVNISKDLAVLPTEETSDKIIAGKTVMVENEQ